MTQNPNVTGFVIGLVGLLSWSTVFLGWMALPRTTHASLLVSKILALGGL